MVDKQRPILIVGGGTFGLSAAYHLALAKYTNITVLEKGTSIPGPQSAANDINKIVRAEYTDPFYSDLALEAIAEWSANPIFQPYYHQTGYLLGVSGAAPELARSTLARQLKSIEAHPAWTGKISSITNRDDIRKVAPALDGDMPGWTGYFNKFAGYAHAIAAMKSIHAEVVRLGVQVELGAHVARLLYERDTTGTRRCVGAETKDGRTYRAGSIILTMGGALGETLPSVGRQIVAKAWVVAHIQLTSGEAERLKGIPVTFMRDLGFFFEPEPGTGLMKFSTDGAVYSNFINGISVTASLEHSSFLPVEAEMHIRSLLREALPSLADRPFQDGHICWCADSADQNYVIDNVPGVDGLIVATGDSGHGFKMLPIAGKWIMEVLEHGHQQLARWQWKGDLDALVTERHKMGDVRDVKDVLKASL